MFWLSSLVLTGALSVAVTQDVHGCPERPHHPDDPCPCLVEADFFRPGPPPAPIHVRSPGIRVTDRPIHVAGPVVHISGPPIYVDAPPVYVSPAQIYLARPEVVVRPGEVIVAPPEVHVEPCPTGRCP